jgi:hypothetical protein
MIDAWFVRWGTETYRPQSLIAHLFLQPPVPLLFAIIHGIRDRTILLPRVGGLVHTVREKLLRVVSSPGAASYELHYKVVDEFIVDIHEKGSGFSIHFCSLLIITRHAPDTRSPTATQHFFDAHQSRAFTTSLIL